MSVRQHDLSMEGVSGAVSRFKHLHNADAARFPYNQNVQKRNLMQFSEIQENAPSCQ